MRTSEQLRQIAEIALALADQRGDTEWNDAQREALNEAYRLLAEVGPIERHFTREPEGSAG